MMYWDTSALVKQYVEEVGSSELHKWKGHVRASSVIAFIEVHSAITRRHRHGSVSLKQSKSIVEQFSLDWQAYVRIPVHADLISVAALLIQRHVLRTLDALHLASALQLQEDLGEPTDLLSADGALVAAARAEGLAVHRISL